MADRFTIRTLTKADVALYRDLRLAALSDTPMAFSSSYEEESLRPLEDFRDRLPEDSVSAVFTAFDGARAVGMAGFQKNASLKSRHKGVMWGVYVAPDCRGKGLAGRLVDAVIAQARGKVMQLECGVAVENPSARRVYHQRGFVPYGVELKAIHIDGVYYDEELLVLDLTK
ncbi:hypothetical protein sos41_15790 [Alphaproteobacteria bacterium SO-S41]|nr:hypothetical protein sos41_15790 [Alphaproteobacteria bacterium SO-S41]